MATVPVVAVDISRALATPDLRWPYPEELQWLAEQATTRKRIVEVGSYLGRSTIAMAANTNGIVWAIDDWYGPRDSDLKDEDRANLLEQFKQNVDGLSVITIKADHGATSAFPPEWLRGPDSERPDMVFIDGDHSYEGCKRDLLIWRARLRPGGLLCGHDRNEGGVRMAINELCPGWKPGPGLLWYWTEEDAMPSALRKMDVGELLLRGTANEIPEPPRLATVPPRAEEWTLSASPGQIPRQFGVGIMIPTVTRNADGTPRHVPMQWATAFRLLAPLANCRDITLSLYDMERGPARETLIEQARSYGCRYGLFLDDDTVPPPDAMQRLQYVLENADDDVAVCAGIYTTKSDPAVPLVFQDIGVGPYWKWKRGDVFECRAIATGCMMIRLDVFDKLPKPWFRDIHSEAEAKELGVWSPTNLLHEWTDDMFFCHRLREAGYRLMAHGGVLCDHWGQDGKCYRLAADSYPMR